MYSNPALVWLRNGLRKTCILRAIQASSFYSLISQGYESRFDAAMMKSLKPGMRVFDIGANVGWYTVKFADLVGRSGSIHAFEPVPASAAMIRKAASKQPWISVHQCAVGDKPGELSMDIDPSSASPTNKIAIDCRSVASDVLTVPVTTIDHMADHLGIPNAIKIDVEGFEWHVFQGGKKTLSHPSLRHIFLEVHFGLLEQRGLPGAVADMRQILSDHGFAVKFTDFSHLHAFRS